MSKELTPLVSLKRLYDFNDLPSRNMIAYLLEQENLPTYYKVIEKSLKALEIIKEKGIVVQFIKETNLVEQYNAGISGYLLKPLTKEEYILLKEVLL